MRNIGILIGIMICLSSVHGQEESKTSFGAGVDVNSRYVWRGLLFSDAPNIQPYMSLGLGNFTAMAWGSYATSNNYAEIDLFLSYNVGAVTFNLNDYYSEDEKNMSANDYTQWTDSITTHLIEASIVYTIPSEKFPLSLTASTFIYGADLDANKEQNYSTYLEASYPFKIDDYDLSVFCGGTLSNGYYADGAGLVNLGMSSSRSLKITETFSVPLNLSLIFHPKNKDVFFVAGVSF